MRVTLLHNRCNHEGLAITLATLANLAHVPHRTITVIITARAGTDPQGLPMCVHTDQCFAMQPQVHTFVLYTMQSHVHTIVL